MNFPRREELRATFEDVAPLYHRARPRYPEGLFNDLLEITRLVPPSRLLEIGSGTGIATLVLAQRGFRIVGVEMDEGMARAARENLAGYERVEIVSASFESYVPHGCFEAVLAFSAFHWIDPSERYQKVASLLCDSGFLVVADARHVVSEDGDPLLTELDADYEGVLGERAHAPGAPGLASLRDEINESGLFSHIAERRYRWELTCTAEAYIDLLDTFPWHRALESSKRAELYALILRRIRARGAGRVAVMFEAVLDVGQAA